MIEIEAQYFAAFREQAGCSQESIATVADSAGALYAELASRHGFSDTMQNCKVAINEELSDWSAPLKNGDVVLIFPPVAGG